MPYKFSHAPVLAQMLWLSAPTFFLVPGMVKISQAKTCRICGGSLPKNPFLDLGKMPLANSFVKPENNDRPESAYPLRVFYCSKCHLVQLADFTAAGEIFDDYAYFSSFSKSWLEHAKKYVDRITDKLKLDASSQVIELASNDGYLLQYFKEKKVPILGIEPSKTVAQAALEKGIPTEICFFGVETAERLKREGKQADLIIGNNVLAHVPDLHDFVGGMKITLKPSGTVTVEFPHLMRLLEQNQFDTIYHEHFSYLSLCAVQDIFGRHGLTVYDVEELSSHGGSLRVYAAHKDSGRKASGAVISLLENEKKEGLFEAGTYSAYTKKVESVKQGLLQFLKRAKADGKTVAAYGAPAKGNTLLNYCGITADLLPYTVDASPHKQGLLLPGSRIPVFAPERIFETKPDYVLILPWNLKREISQQMAGIREWGGRFVTAIPHIQISEQ